MTATRHLVAMGLAVASTLPAVIGCSGDAPIAPHDAGAFDVLAFLAEAGYEAGSPGGGGGGGGDGGDGGFVIDAGPDSLYLRLGEHDGLRSKMDHVIQAELGDPVIASYFSNQTAVTLPPGHPTLAQISECMTDFLGSKLGGTEIYPALATDGTSQFFCRAIVAIHIFMNITGGTLERFIMIAAGALQSVGVRNDDIQAIGSALASASGDILNPAFVDAGPLSADAARGL